MAGKWIRPLKRLTIYLRDDFRCVYCGKDMRKADPNHITLDHVKPRARNGQNDPGNLVTSCKSCNSARGDRPLHEWADWGTRQAVRRHTARSIKRHECLARRILEGHEPDYSSYQRWHHGQHVIPVAVRHTAVTKG